MCPPGFLRAGLLRFAIWMFNDRSGILIGSFRTNSSRCGTS
jgi:hypothetical protein